MIFYLFVVFFCFLVCFCLSGGGDGGVFSLICQFLTGWFSCCDLLFRRESHCVTYAGPKHRILFVPSQCVDNR